MCNALDILVRKGKISEAYNIGSKFEYKNIDIVKIIAHVNKKKINKNIKFVKDRPFNDFRYSINFNKIKKLGWKPITKVEDKILEINDWYKRNIKNELINQNKIISYWLKFLDKKNYQGIHYEIIPDPTGNKINRLRLIINKKRSKFTAQSLAYHLEKNNPSIYVRDDLIHLNHFEIQ